MKQVVTPEVVNEPLLIMGGERKIILPLAFGCMLLALYVSVYTGVVVMAMLSTVVARLTKNDPEWWSIYWGKWMIPDVLDAFERTDFDFEIVEDDMEETWKESLARIAA